MNNYSSLLVLLIIATSAFAQNPTYDLIWSDEFNGNGAIDIDKWHHQTQLPNGTSWYNGEIQHYTNREENSFVSNGTLKIIAKKGFFIDQGVVKEYTSARLNSKIAFTYGKVEVRAKLPSGVGTWPAIWSLGQNIIEPGGYWTATSGTTNWPACGELDIMEHWGNNQNYIQSAIHSPSSYGNTFNKGGQVVSGASNDFHLYTMEWTSEKIIFSVDNIVHYTYEPENQNAATWPFDANQYLLLNVAIQSDIEPAFTQSEMEIDYVRIFQEQNLNIVDNPLSTITVYPNPATSILKMTILSRYLGTQLEIYSMLNQKILFLEITSENLEIDVSAFQKGPYIIQFKNDKNSETKIFVKI
jgi:beta-glucanase (GH16 family)